jgi:hypothetical protein
VPPSLAVPAAPGRSRGRRRGRPTRGVYGARGDQNHAGNRVCEYLAFDGDGGVVSGHATYQTDAAAAASGIDAD